MSALGRLGSLAIVTLLAAGCAVPSWMPLIGKSKPLPDPGPPAASPSPSALAIPRERLPESAGVLDRVICVVNNDAITLYELDEAEAHFLYESKQQNTDGEARQQLRQRLLQSLIESRVQLQQAEREKIVVEDSEMHDQLSEIMKRVNVSSQRQFEDLLKAQGLTLDGVKKRLREQIMVQRVVRRKVTLRVSVTEQEIDRYLQENRDKLETGLEFEARHILFLPEAGKGDEGWEVPRLKAQQVYALLLEGQHFQELAKKHSEDGSGKDGGSLGTLKRGELAPDIEAAILRLKPGESSSPFRSQVGYHLFHLDSKESLSAEALAQTRNQVRDILYRQKYDTRLQEWLAEIKQRAIIDIRL